MIPGRIMEIKNRRKLIFILPNFCTALNLACGFSSIVFTLEGQIYWSCILLCGGGFFDIIDGRIARIVGGESSFGEQFDSMIDLVSFGVAPFIMLYQNYLRSYGWIGIFLAFSCCLCIAIRLARFNINLNKIPSTYFQGLPAPVTALGLAGFVLLDLKLGEPMMMRSIIIPYTVFYVSLSISSIPFLAFKKLGGRKSVYVYLMMAALVMIFLSLAFLGGFVIGIFVAIYILVSLIYFLTHLDKYRGIFKTI